MDKMNYADWMTAVLTAIAYLWIVSRSCLWVMRIVAYEWVNRRSKDRKQRAVNELYDSFNLEALEVGSTLKVATKGNLVLIMYRKEHE